MRKNLRLKKELKESKEIWLECSDCGSKTSHKILADIEYSDASPDYDIQVWGNWYIVQCNGCKEIAACHKTTCSEEIGYDPDTGRECRIPSFYMYPERIPGAKVSDEYMKHLPYNIYSMYSEVYSSLALDNKILPGIGIRAIIEAVCKDKNMRGHNLEAKIDSLCSEGYTTEDGKNILHSLRFMGNKSAHRTKAHTHTELISALKVVDHVLYSVYILPEIAEKLPDN